MSLSTILLLANALWDLLSAAAILIRTHLLPNHCLYLADAHLALWADEADRQNLAASATMAFLLLQWAIVRLRGAAAGPVSDAACVDAAASYVVEAAMVAFEVAAGRMHALGGWAVVVLSFVCWAIVVRECVEGV
jgi:hypothetical protein